jgi:hypothetical protein
MPLTLNGTTGITTPAGLLINNAPAFSAYASVSQTITNGVATKLQANTEEFDTNGNYDNATNYRFTPTVAGYYQVSGQISATSSVTVTRIIPVIYKNGTAFKYGVDMTVTIASRSAVSSLIYFNGSTDYVELYTLLIGTGTLSTSINAPFDNYFQGVLVRGA